MPRAVYLGVECPMCGRSWIQREGRRLLVTCSHCTHVVELIPYGYNLSGSPLDLLRPLEELRRPLRYCLEENW
jgi:hypothetical protein